MIQIGRRGAVIGQKGTAIGRTFIAKGNIGKMGLFDEERTS